MNIKYIFVILILLNLHSCAELPSFQQKEPKQGLLNQSLEVLEPETSRANFNKGISQIGMRTMIRKGLIEFGLFKSIVNFNGDLQLIVINNEKDEIQELNFLSVRHKIKLTFTILKDKREVYKKDFDADEVATGTEKFIYIERVRYATEKATHRCLEQFLEDISKQKL
ncbi:hypothetical protein ND861_15245 [Leptospira sp. 2 VSF19]|uniref:Lipoprotein n=1 Tax=Leptospira soteropolitanensis TaxID=2950025 RepID=A0AAW5VIP2_9LEPT|nr:hypothetical protein [Leptospira soteropolitanensis]MCW7494001.1 hypothetical protein [Leptospira soteropolitanensis]MCW7501733.1 hypothetical protein [Leptospira soteropolitanensis]MCW7523847.1 hypothetical protein [Leptospira soteropolitanensis]MCW7527712.1 hypothetical protein [Leptospira soteropolitanensis]MCW7531703.1 hypothetical protein [Leptospira soteropolitanensis]